MPRTQVDDVLSFDGAKVAGKGTLERTAGEVMKTLWVRVCQRDHHTQQLSIAEGMVDGDPSSVYRGPPDNTWARDLPVLQGSFQEGDASVSLALVFEDAGDLFTLTWSECAHLEADGTPSA